uniref:Uncharacterized protein n=1 Tax=Klebsiella pneumoniae TaxID=573 RepID=A0A8B0SX41_KLEPN|nr:hypothetical protein [Klebsiella pneumoniae]
MAVYFHFALPLVFKGWQRYAAIRVYFSAVVCRQFTHQYIPCFQRAFLFG